MWTRNRRAALTGIDGGLIRRRGAKIGLAIAILAVIPGLVAGTSFINGQGSTNGTLTGTGTSTAVECGFTTTAAQNPNQDSYVTITGSGTNYGSSGVYSAVSVALNEVPTSGVTGYQYEDGELNVACYDAPSGTTMQPSVATTGVAGASWAVATIESIAATTTAPNKAYCVPAGTTPASCTGSASDPSCITATASVPADYLPNDGDVTASNWYAYNSVPTSANTLTCGTMTTMSVATTVAGTVTYFGIVSFALSDNTASTGTTWALTLTVV